MPKDQVIIRVDFNVPVENGIIQDPIRILSVKDTIEHFRSCRVILISHFKDPKFDELSIGKYSFASILDEIKKYIERDIILMNLFDDSLQAKIDAAPQDSLILLDNSRFWPGEKTCNDGLSRRIASLGSVFINDAFSCAHREHASVTGVAKYLPTYPGYHFQSELKALARAFKGSDSDILAIIGGSKISTKLPILENLLPKVKYFAVGGAMANTFLLAKGYQVGCSLFEEDYVDKARELLHTYADKIMLPCDVMVAPDLNTPPAIADVDQIPENQAVYDVGPSTACAYVDAANRCSTVVWNGTLGVAESPLFCEGSKAVAMGICDAPAFSLAGGGDTLAALAQFGLAERFSHVCTGGGAFLEWLAHGELPAERTFTPAGLDVADQKLNDSERLLSKEVRDLLRSLVRESVDSV
ncbi:MAG: phosphoglycerate kinase [Holosporales bacterium]|jgi:phosphoglycerate kinase|nr:phosphoglycerate kinase [Holosporales bacterium]